MDRIDEAVVFFQGARCGVLSRVRAGYRFQYDADYLARRAARPLSRSLPLRAAAFESEELFGYFAGLVSEGWLLRQQSILQKTDSRDYLTLLACNGEDMAGAVSVRPAPPPAGGEAA